jgi:hypothetical protein
MESAPMQAQILLSRYRNFRERQPEFADVEASHREAVVSSGWRSLVRDALYERVTDPGKAARSGYNQQRGRKTRISQ